MIGILFLASVMIVPLAMARRPRDYLLVASDGTADYRDIGSAINALTPTIRKVRVKDGVYTLASSIMIPSNVDLQGYGTGAIIRAGNGMSTARWNGLLTIDRATNVLIANLEIDGNMNSNPTSGSWAVQNGITVAKSGQISVSNVYIHDTPMHGILVYASTGSYFDRVTIKRTGYGGACFRIMAQSHGITVSNSYFENPAPGFDGIYINDSYDNTIVSSTAADCQYDGFGISGRTSHGNRVQNNVQLRNMSGIFVDGADSNMITGNTLTNNQLWGISLSGSEAIGGWASHNIIMWNVCTGTGQQYGITFNDVTRSVGNTITNNDFRGNGLACSLPDGATIGTTSAYSDNAC